MKIKRLWLLAAAAIACSGGTAFAQYNFYKFIFNGTAYQTNSTGNIVATPITDQTLLADRANAGGIYDLSTVAIAYHLNGDPKGDTVEIVSTNGTSLTFEFGFWFGSDPSLGRSAVTNATGTEIRRVDYLYTLDNGYYVHSNPDSIGSAFTSKRFLTDTNGNVHPTIQGTMSWECAPQGTNGTILCVGSFTLGAGLF